MQDNDKRTATPEPSAGAETSPVQDLFNSYDGDIILVTASQARDQADEVAQARKNTPAIGTGFPGLDKLMGGGLEPGLYTIGASPGMGKTSLCLNMASAISRHRRVLYISFEQPPYKLEAKRMASESARVCLETGADLSEAFTPEQIDNYYHHPLTDAQKEAYARQNADTPIMYAHSPKPQTTDFVRHLIRAVQHVHKDEQAPIVIIDYLQRLTNDARDVRERTDRAVYDLQGMTTEFATTIIAISSTSRGSYDSPTLSSFKESGGVEYSSDCAMALYRPTDGQTGPDYTEVRARLLKQRMGPADPAGGIEITLAYYGKYGLFNEWQRVPQAKPTSKKYPKV